MSSLLCDHILSKLVIDADFRSLAWVVLFDPFAFYFAVKQIIFIMRSLAVSGGWLEIVHDTFFYTVSFFQVLVYSRRRVFRRQT